MTDLVPQTSTTPSVLDGVDIDKARVLRALGFNIADPNTQAALLVADRYDLDPVMKHVVLVEGNVFISRDGLLHVAHRSGQFDGMSVDSLDDMGDEWRAVVTVHRKDMAHPFTFPGRFPKEQKTRNGLRAHPYAEEMAIKCAESHALRRAFPVSGLGVADENHSGAITATATEVEPPTIDPHQAALAELDQLVQQIREGSEEAKCWETWKESVDRWWQSPERVAEAIGYVGELLAHGDVVDVEFVDPQTLEEGCEDPTLPAVDEAAGGGERPESRGATATEESGSGTAGGPGPHDSVRDNTGPGTSESDAR